MVLEFIVTGIALAMDASAVSISDGMYDCKMNYKRSIFIALVFGVFQGLMPIIGYYAGRLVAGFSFMEDISNYLIFGIFVFLGANMIYESTKKDEEVVSKLTVGKILLQGVATSIDALFIGVSFALKLDVNIYQAALIIAFITFVFCIVSVFIGRGLGNFLKNKAELLGGLILIAMGIRELIEGLFL